MTRVILANCYDSRDHEIHVSKPRPSMFQCVDDLEIRLCPGGRMGDKRVREYAGRIDELAEIVRIEQVSRELAALIEQGKVDQPTQLSPRQPHQVDDDPCDEPPEPDFDEDYEADRAADRYEAWLFRD